MKKQIISVALALTTAATLFSGAMAAYAESTSSTGVTDTNEETTLKTGDILTFNKSDWNIEQKSIPNAAESDKLYVYSTRLDENGEKSLVAYLDADNGIDSAQVVYNAQYGYTVKHVNGVAGNNVGIISWSSLQKDGSWKTFYSVGGKTHIQMPPLTVRFTEETIGEVYNLIDYDTPINIYKKNGEKEEFCQTVYKGNSENIDTDTVLFVNGNEYESYSWSVDIDCTEVYERAEKHITGTVKGALLADKPYITSKDVKAKTQYLSESNSLDELTTPRVVIFNLEFPETDEKGNLKNL